MFFVSMLQVYHEMPSDCNAYFMTTTKQMAKEEVIEVAASVPLLSSSWREISLDEASSMVGLPPFTDAELASGCSVQRVFELGDGVVYFLLSDEALKWADVQTQSQLCDILARPDPEVGVKIILSVDTEVPVAPGPEIDLVQALAGDDEVLDLGGRTVVYVCKDGYNELKWLTDNALYSLRASGELSVDQLSEIVRWVG